MKLPQMKTLYVDNVNRLNQKVKQLNVRKLYQRPNLMD